MNHYKISLRKHYSTWYYFTENPQGGGFGSNISGTMTAAIRLALRSVQDYASFSVTINSKEMTLRQAQIVISLGRMAVPPCA